MPDRFVLNAGGYAVFYASAELTASVSKSDTKFASLAGILAFGLLVSGLIGSQVLNLTVAQTNDNGEQEEADLISAPFYHGSGTSTVSASGTATVKVQPDKFSVIVGVETEGATAEKAASSNTDLVAAVIAALRELGITEEDIVTNSYNVHPVHSQSEPVNICRVIEGYSFLPECYVTGEVVSYKAVNMVTVTLDADGDVDAGEVIDTAIEAGATNVSGVYFFTSAERQEEIRGSLVGNAIANARHRAEVAAEAAWLSISGIK
ncbi:MAG: SIMPL domain-containing protein [Thermoproteota archaeon]